MERITPENITKLSPNKVFVFGSNLVGKHGCGAAKTALKWGAKCGVGEGFSGQTYAIPTKDIYIQTLPLRVIKEYVDEFIDVVKNYNELIFLVTKIGCGLAGYKAEDIAPLFKECLELENVYLPKEFIEIIKMQNENN